MTNYETIINLYNNASLYNNEFKNYDDDFTFWEFWIDNYKPKNILEIGIGNGRLYNLLSPKVKQYDGIEISENIIEEFKKKYKLKNGMLYNQDMKNINIPYTYDLIIIPFNTFSYLYTLDDIKCFFKGIKTISNTNTIIIIDVFNPSIDDISNINKFRLCNTFKVKNVDIKVFEKHTYNKKEQVITYYKKYKDNEGEKTLALPVRVFYPQEIDSILQMLGFKIIKKYGDYNNEEFCSNSRKQIIFLKGSDH